MLYVRIYPCLQLWVYWKQNIFEASTHFIQAYSLVYNLGCMPGMFSMPVTICTSIFHLLTNFPSMFIPYSYLCVVLSVAIATCMWLTRPVETALLKLTINIVMDRVVMTAVHTICHHWFLMQSWCWLDVEYLYCIKSWICVIFYINALLK